MKRPKRRSRRPKRVGKQSSRLFHHLRTRRVQRRFLSSAGTLLHRSSSSRNARCAWSLSLTGDGSVADVVVGRLFVTFSTETVKDLQDKWNNVDFDEGMGGSSREFLEVCRSALNRFHQYLTIYLDFSQRLRCPGEPFDLFSKTTLIFSKSSKTSMILTRLSRSRRKC